MSVAYIEVEEENFIEIGCCFYRASTAIMELQSTENSPTNAMEFLQSLSKSVGLAKDLVQGLLKGNKTVSGSEIGSIVPQLEGVIRSMGKHLSSIPSSTFKEEKYAEVAIQSLSKEMQNSRFEVKVAWFGYLEMQVLSPNEQPNEETATLEEKDLYSINVEVSTRIPTS